MMSLNAMIKDDWDGRLLATLIPPVWELVGLYNSIVYIHKRFASNNVKAILN